MSGIENIRKQYWGMDYCRQRRANRVKNKRKASRMEMTVIEEINRRVEEMAKTNSEAIQLAEPTDCKPWQWDILMNEQDDELEIDED